MKVPQLRVDEVSVCSTAEMSSYPEPDTQVFVYAISIRGLDGVGESFAPGGTRQRVRRLNREPRIQILRLILHSSFIHECRAMPPADREIRASQLSTLAATPTTGDRPPLPV